MKFVHIADVHLGMQPDFGFPWSKSRQIELYETFFRVIEFCKEEKVDLLLIAGDLFHRQPNRRELAEIISAMKQCDDTQIVLIAGNHDYIAKDSLYETEEWPPNVKVLSREKMEVLHYKGLNTYVYGYSYETQDIKENRLENVIPLNQEGYHILLAHGGDSKNNPLSRQEIVDTPFDYMALGHIHKPERIGEHAAYAGSLEPLDKTETGAHGFILGNLEEGDCHLTFVNFAKRHYEQLVVTVEPDMTNHTICNYIKKRIQDKGNENIYKIRLEGTISRELRLNKEALFTMGNVVEVVDHTNPDFDYEELFHENQDNIIGMYIDAIEKMDLNDEEKDLALYYGVKAFEDSKRKER